MLAIGMLMTIGLNTLMTGFHEHAYTNPKAGFWTLFTKYFEVSGFDAFPYIIVSQWRPLYALMRHPLLSVMLWPLAQVNEWLSDCMGINCAIYVVAAVWSCASLCSWMLTYAIMRRIVGLTQWLSALLTFFFFSLAYVMLTIFTPDHMTLTLPLLLTAVYLSGTAIQEKRPVRLWKMLVLMFVSTAITTTNCMKIAIADFQGFSWRAVRRYLWYALPLSLIVAAFLLQPKTGRTTLMAFTEQRADRITTVVENVFGEGLQLHEDHLLKDPNKHRPVVVAYRHWWNYAIEGLMVAMLIAGVFAARRQRIMWMLVLMFLFDMLIHVGFSFASADVYIMTSHWAFVIPLAVAFLIKSMENNRLRYLSATALTFLLTSYLWYHNLSLIIRYITA